MCLCCTIDLVVYTPASRSLNANSTFVRRSVAFTLLLRAIESIRVGLLRRFEIFSRISHPREPATFYVSRHLPKGELEIDTSGGPDVNFVTVLIIVNQLRVAVARCAACVTSCVLRPRVPLLFQTKISHFPCIETARIKNWSSVTNIRIVLFRGFKSR